ncbi:hypothetical protein AtNW77_Chr2g0257491 [Arabidopsis thaliana]|uniref:Uncharacterized protein n=3 Tax=Arabidopsis TaxID=3701 RepID=A0A178VMM6_ARATH|nr:hypothetical protein ISN45_At02g031170 [Arabidopsis thaliana x Arabidopsis arenosa]KAG7643323.1 hypothetical protein ISN44_As02g031430 [Arabidopsis suecica]OAP07730.1 hypothetical protein AXX17_AT2G33180 [Arabidopsis thaliana]
MSGKTSITSRPDEFQRQIDHKEMPRDHQIERHTHIHTTRYRGGSLVEEVIEKLERFKVRTVNILVRGEDDEQKK